MINLLPPNFPVSGLDPGETSKLEWFYRRYADEYYEDYRYGHFLLAAYSAVPALLTPDLMYKLWQNFNSYKWGGAPVSIHRVAVSDILLSPLCREVGYELFEMSSNIRFALLKWLGQESLNPVWKKRELRTVEEIALFVEEYHRLPNEALYRWGQEYSELQVLEAVSYTRPDEAAAVLLSKLHQAAEKNQEPELMRTMERFIKTSKRIHYLNAETAAPSVLEMYSSHSHLLEAWSELIQENSDGFVEKIRTDKTLMKYLQEFGNGGIPVKMSGTAAEKFQRLISKKTRILIAGGSSQSRTIPTAGDIYINDAEYVMTTIKGNYIPEEIQLVGIIGESFVKHSVLQALSSIAGDAQEKDDIIVYFSAEAKNADGHDYLECYDSDPAFSDMNGWISDEQIQTVLSKANCASITLILQIDADPSVGWLNPEDDKNLVFFSGRNPSEDLLLQGKLYSRFTRDFSSFIFRFGHRENNRLIFSRLLHEQQKNPDPLHPFITGTKNGLKRIFKSDNSSMVRMQDLLRETGFMHTFSSGQWNTITAEALTNFARGNELSIKESRQYYVSKLEEIEINMAEFRVPVWLFVFSDPAGNLPFMVEEKNHLMEICSGHETEFSFETVVLENPDLKKVKETFVDPAYRNRIQLVYLAGFDLNGDLILSDGAFTVDEFSRLLDYQDRIDLLVMNTCRSDGFASYATQLGVKHAFGVSGKINDDQAMQSGIYIIEQIFEGRNLTELFPEFYR